jgi:putative nucleotidyltransferase with HDIG domain
LDQERFEHSLRVEKMAVRLARKWGVSVKLASQAALLHDCAKRPEQGGTGHAPDGARLAKSHFGITSPAVLSAIKRHTVGAAGMSRLDKIVYLADHLEEERDYPGVKKLRLLAGQDLDRAVLTATTLVLKHLLGRHLPIDPQTLITRNYYLKRSEK